MQFPNEIPAKVSVADHKRKEQFKKMSPDSSALHVPGGDKKRKVLRSKKTGKCVTY
jgi:hypothetical protein